VRGGKIVGFRTFMTGEIYGLLAQHSILARTLDANAPLDDAAYRCGIARAGDGGGLLHNAFGMRALGLFGRLSPAESASYLSGLLIGEELGPGTASRRRGDRHWRLRARRALCSRPRREGGEGAHVRRGSDVGRPEGAGMSADRFKAAMRELPLIAILRGLKPQEAGAIGDVLVEAGFRLIEVPLNSPQPFDSIARLRKRLPQAMVGAGTVLTAAEVRDVTAAGGELVVAPNFEREVVVETVRLGMASLPGIMTPTEAFAALAAGAHGLKLFPAELASPAVVKAMLAVLPKGTLMLPVGGIAADNLAGWHAAGASGFGLGSSLYKPGDDAATVRAKAANIVAAYRMIERGKP
jgi:2-dehydro-3-deoxyphosphogalactonate aldolase